MANKKINKVKQTNKTFADVKFILSQRKPSDYIENKNYLKDNK